jgi:RNA polymerase sigma factor (sigma-70 family)
MDYQDVSHKALGSLRRRAVTEYIEAEELLSVGVLALVEAAPTDEALAVVIARRAMIDAVRRNERRERGRVWPVMEDVTEDDDLDALDTLMSSGGRALAPATVHADIWEVMKALPAREYQIVTLHFWGGKSQAAIAIELGVSQMTVSRSLENAKNLMAECLNGKFHPITNTRGDGTQRTVLSGRKDAA